MVGQLALTNIEADTCVCSVQPSSVLLKAWVLIGHWRVDKLQWRAFVLLMDDRYCSMHPKLLDPWTFQNQQYSSLSVAGGGLTVLVSHRRKVTYSSAPSTRMAAVVEGFWCQHWFPFSGKVAAGPQSQWPVHRSEAGWCDNSCLSLFASEPSSQVSFSIVTWKNVGCRCRLADQHADEETFYFRAGGRDLASGATYVHTRAHVGEVPIQKNLNWFCNIC